MRHEVLHMPPFKWRHIGRVTKRFKITSRQVIALVSVVFRKMGWEIFNKRGTASHHLICLPYSKNVAVEGGHRANYFWKTRSISIVTF